MNSRIISVVLDEITPVMVDICLEQRADLSKAHKIQMLESVPLGFERFIVERPDWNKIKIRTLVGATGKVHMLDLLFESGFATSMREVMPADEQIRFGFLPPMPTDEHHSFLRDVWITLIELMRIKPHSSLGKRLAA